MTNRQVYIKRAIELIKKSGASDEITLDEPTLDGVIAGLKGRFGSENVVGMDLKQYIEHQRGKLHRLEAQEPKLTPARPHGMAPSVPGVVPSVPKVDMLNKRSDSFSENPKPKWWTNMPGAKMQRGLSKVKKAPAVSANTSGPALGDRKSVV